MAYNLFQRRGTADAAPTDFLETQLSLPPPPEAARVDVAAPMSHVDAKPSTPAFQANDSGHSAHSGHSGHSGLDSGVPDVVTDLGELGGDSLPAPHSELDVARSPTTSHIGRYALKGLIGEGGLGQVHEAWDPLLSRTVAVKTLQFASDTPTRVSLDAMFLNEARAAAGLSHPHIVTVHDAGLSAHGVYIAMERLRGSDLRQRLAQGWQPTQAQAALLVRRVADALAYAHANGVVHCDIKPANIFLNKRDKPKVLDFGIARVVHGSALGVSDGDTPAAASGAIAAAQEASVAGTPQYLAPEQLQRGRVDSRTDIHALGVVFYELLTGRKAREGDRIEVISHAVLNTDPPPAHEVREGVSRMLSGIAAKAMARDPAARYANASDLSHDLRRWLEKHNADPLPLESTQTRSTAPSSRRKKTTRGMDTRTRISVGLLVLMLCAGAALALSGSWREKPVAGAVSAPEAASVEPQSLDGRNAAPATAAVDRTAPNAGAVTEAAPPGSATTAAPMPGAKAPAADPAANRKAAATRSKTNPASNDKPTAAAPAAAAATGSVQFAISPWGQIEVNGSDAGITPPMSRLTLPEGTHRITVRNGDAPPFTTTVQVTADTPVTVRHRVAP